MSRPGFVLEVDDRTPPLVVHEGLGFRLENFPLGTRVVYPPESLPAVPDVDGAIRRRAAATRTTPSRCPRCSRAGMRLTIAFDDISLPLPPMQAPDIRQRIIEQVLTMAAEAGVDDVELIAANALHRRMTAAELKHIVGERVFRSFYPQGLLYNHDAEDRDDLLHIGTDRPGRGRRDQQAGRRVRPAGLRQRQPGGDGRRPQVGRRSGWRRTSRCGTTTTPRRWCTRARSWTTRSPTMHHSAWRMGRLLSDHLKVFQIETTLNNDVFPAPLRLPDEARVGVVGQGPGSMLAARRGLAVAPEAAAAQDVPRHPRALRADRHQRRRDRGGARADASRRCTSSSWSRCRASPTCW